MEQKPQKTFWRSIENGIVISVEHPPFRWEEVSEEEYREYLGKVFDNLTRPKTFDTDTALERMNERINRPRRGERAALWRCPNCGTGNEHGNSVCWSCSRRSKS